MFDLLKKKFKGFTENVSESVNVSLGDKAKAALFDKEFVLDEKSVEGPFFDLEMALLEGDVSFEVTELILNGLRSELVGKRRNWVTSAETVVHEAIRSAITNILEKHPLDFDEFVESKISESKPIIILFVGVNGTGKTTTIAKIASRLNSNGHSVVLANGDTFRAGASEQIQIHANRMDLKVIQHEHKGDPAAVVYDAVQYAKSRSIDVVLADTAGRLHTNVNLMDQLKKITRINNPDLVLLVDEAIAGNDAVERAKKFSEKIKIDGCILTKADADAKGGAALSISHTVGCPILFIGVGQEYKDLVKFKPESFLDSLLN